MEIERRLSAIPVPDFVQKEWETDLIINSRGVAVDMEMLAKTVEIMSRPIPWAPGLPLGADGWVGKFFKKD